MDPVLNLLPTINAGLNTLSAVFLSLGFLFIKKKNIPAHRRCMKAAFLTSTIFLASYLYYHFHAGVTRFAGTGLIRTIYFSILLTHTVLAVVIVPLIFTSFFYAWRMRFDRHAQISRWTWPLWMYVSVTGVVIYAMLYHLV